MREPGPKAGLRADAVPPQHRTAQNGTIVVSEIATLRQASSMHVAPGHRAMTPAFGGAELDGMADPESKETTRLPCGPETVLDSRPPSGAGLPTLWPIGGKSPPSSISPRLLPPHPSAQAVVRPQAMAKSRCGRLDADFNGSIPRASPSAVTFRWNCILNRATVCHVTTTESPSTSRW